MKKTYSDHLLTLIIAGVAVQLFIYHYKEWRETKRRLG